MYLLWALKKRNRARSKGFITASEIINGREIYLQKNFLLRQESQLLNVEISIFFRPATAELGIVNN